MEIATMLMSAHKEGRVRAAIGRGSDFFGPYARQSLVGDGVFARAMTGKPAQLLGSPEVPHSVTFIDDFGRALVTLGGRQEALGEVWRRGRAAPPESGLAAADRDPLNQIGLSSSASRRNASADHLGAEDGTHPRVMSPRGWSDQDRAASDT